MRVFLFGLSPWRTNPMYLSIEFIQFVLPTSTSTYNTFMIHQYMIVYVFIALIALLPFMLFTIHCLLVWLEYTTHFYLHVYYLCTSFWFILRTRWVAFWQPWTCMFRSRSLEYWEFLLLIRVAQRKRGDLIANPLDLSRLVGSWDFSFLLESIYRFWPV